MLSTGRLWCGIYAGCICFTFSSADTVEEYDVSIEMCKKYGLQERAEDYRVIEGELIEWSRPSALLYSRYTNATQLIHFVVHCRLLH